MLGRFTEVKFDAVALDKSVPVWPLVRLGAKIKYAARRRARSRSRTAITGATFEKETSSIRSLFLRWRTSVWAANSFRTTVGPASEFVIDLGGSCPPPGDVGRYPGRGMIVP